MRLPLKLFVICSAGVVGVAFGQTESGNRATRGPAATYIPHSLEVPAFVPPAPPLEKKVPEMRVDASITVATRSSRTLTVIRGEASALPDLPPPPVSKPQMARELTPEEIEQAKIWRRHQLNLGATVYDRKVSQVHWQHPDTGESYEALCGFDVGLLAGTGGFIHNGESYSLMLSHSDGNISQLRQLPKKWMKDPSMIPGDSITVLKGNSNDPVGMASITVIRDLIASEKSRLMIYQVARRNHMQTATEWEKAHPVAPRDETFWFRPHRGSRYLNDPQPEKREASR